MADVLVKKDIDQSDLVKNQKEPKSKVKVTLGEHLIDLKNGVNLKVFLEGAHPAFLITYRVSQKKCSLARCFEVGFF